MIHAANTHFPSSQGISCTSLSELPFRERKSSPLATPAARTPLTGIYADKAKIEAMALVRSPAT